MANEPDSQPPVQGAQALASAPFQTLAANATGAGTKLLLAADTASAQTFMDSRFSRWDASNSLLKPKAPRENLTVTLTVEFKPGTLLPASTLTIWVRNLASGNLLRPHQITVPATLPSILDAGVLVTGVGSDSWPMKLRPLTPATVTAGYQFEAVVNGNASARITNIQIEVTG